MISNIKKNKLLECLAANLGNITLSCAEAGCSRWTYYNLYEKNADFKKQADDIQNIALDAVENALLRNIRDGDTTAIIFYLKCKGKSRGYVEKTDKSIFIQPIVWNEELMPMLDISDDTMDSDNNDGSI